MAIMVSCDVVMIPAAFAEGVCSEVKKTFIIATHTHTAPVLTNDAKLQYPIPEGGQILVVRTVKLIEEIFTENE